MFQQIAVAIIGVAVAVTIIVKISKLVKKGKSGCGCEGCDGCKLKGDLKKNLKTK